MSATDPRPADTIPSAPAEPDLLVDVADDISDVVATLDGVARDLQHVASLLRRRAGAGGTR